MSMHRLDVVFTRKGMISKMMSVAGTPINPKMPTEAPTERRTIMTPKRPRVILLSMRIPLQENLPYWPRERVM